MATHNGLDSSKYVQNRVYNWRHDPYRGRRIRTPTQCRIGAEATQYNVKANRDKLFMNRITYCCYEMIYVWSIKVSREKTGH